jgi:hypothetical protein
MTAMRRRIGLLVLAAATMLVGPAAASAGIFLAFEQRAAAPGDTVVAKTTNSLGKASPFFYGEGGVEYVVYLAPLGKASTLLRPRDLRANHVVVAGELVGDAKTGIGTVRFKVPNIPPGLYATRMWCPSCGSFVPDRRPANTAVGKRGILRVTAPTEDRRSAALPVAAGGALHAILVASAGIARRRRES